MEGYARDIFLVAWLETYQRIKHFKHLTSLSTHQVPRISYRQQQGTSGLSAGIRVIVHIYIDVSHLPPRTLIAQLLCAAPFVPTIHSTVLLL